jgi:hypothetical protein
VLAVAMDEIRHDLALSDAARLVVTVFAVPTPRAPVLGASSIASAAASTSQASRS